MKYNGFSVDAEANGFVFESSKLWVLTFEDLDTNEKLKLHPFRDSKAREKFLGWLDRYDSPNISFHNGLGYDIFIFKFLLGLDFQVGPDLLEGRNVNFVDTFYLSMFLNPDRNGHSIEDWGTRVGMPKIDFRKELIDAGFLSADAPEGAEFMEYHQIMDTYCERDTLVGKKTFHALIDEWVELYGSWDCNEWPQHFRAGQKSFHLMACQELAGWKFDIPAAKALKVRIAEMMEEIRAEVEPKLPPRALKKSEEKEYSMPAKPFKKDGSLSATMEKWVAKHNAEVVGEKVIVYGKEYPIHAGLQLDVKLPMEMANQDQMKDWFLKGHVKNEYIGKYEKIWWEED